VCTLNRNAYRRNKHGINLRTWNLPQGMIKATKHLWYESL
jgi:hypothetical protein